MSLVSTTVWLNVTSDTISWTQEQIYVYLNKLSEKSWNSRWPITIYLVTLVVLGVFGNTVVLIIYRRKFRPCATRAFILTLTFLDLLTNILGIPLQVVTIRLAYNSYSLWLCRSVYVFTTLPPQASGLILVLIAIDRYHRICSPLEMQQTAKRAWRSVLISTGICCIVFSAFIPLYGLHTVPTNTTGVDAVMCWIHDEFRNTQYDHVYTVVVGVTFGFSFGIICMAYVFITMEIFKRRRRRSVALTHRSLSFHSKRSARSIHEYSYMDLASRRSLPDDTSINTSDAEVQYHFNVRLSVPKDINIISVENITPALDLSSDSWDDLASVDPPPVYDNENTNPPQHSWERQISLPGAAPSMVHDLNVDGDDDTPTFTSESAHVQRGDTGKRKSVIDIKPRTGLRQKIQSKTPTMTATLTTFYVINWLPHLLARSIYNTPINLCPNFTECESNIYDFALRSYFINSTMNALLYGFCNHHFQRELRCIVAKLFRKRTDH